MSSFDSNSPEQPSLPDPQSLPSNLQPLTQVFVYGTLKPGECYYAQYCEGKVVESYEAIALGQLFDLPMGYPAMTEGDRPVWGFLLSFAESAALDELDELEGYDPNGPTAQNEYQRQLIEVFNSDRQPMGLAWGYRMTVEQASQLGGVLLPNGKWSGKPTSR